MKNVALSCVAQVENCGHEKIVISTFTSTSPKPSKSIFAVVVIQFVISPNNIPVWEWYSHFILMEDCYLLLNQANTVFISADNSQHTAFIIVYMQSVDRFSSCCNLIVKCSNGWNRRIVSFAISMALFSSPLRNGAWIPRFRVQITFRNEHFNMYGGWWQQLATHVHSWNVSCAAIACLWTEMFRWRITINKWSFRVWTLRKTNDKLSGG